MKRLVLAISMLVIVIVLAVSGNIVFNKKLTAIQNETIYIMKTNSEKSRLQKTWEKSEVIFGLILCDEKYKNLERHIFTLDKLDSEEFIYSCKEILFEIQEIRKSQKFLIENIL